MQRQEKAWLLCKILFQPLSPVVPDTLEGKKNTKKGKLHFKSFSRVKIHMDDLLCRNH